MALIRTGGIVGQISGRVGAEVYSHNRYGSYVRQGTTPVTSTTEYALATKAKMTACTQAWQNLTAAQKLSWNSWAQTNPTINRLGETITLTGHAAYVSLNARLLMCGVGQATDPPVIPAPAPLATMSITADIGPGGCIITFSATPVPAGNALHLRACVLDSTGINFVENLIRIIQPSLGEQATGYDYKTVIEARFGALQVDQIVVMKAAVISNVNGQLSTFLRAQATVVDTTP